MTTCSLAHSSEAAGRCTAHCLAADGLASAALDLWNDLLELQQAVPSPEFYQYLGEALPLLGDASISAADVVSVLREARPEELACTMDGVEQAVLARMPAKLSLCAAMPSEGSVLWWSPSVQRAGGAGSVARPPMVHALVLREQCVLKFLDGTLALIPLRWEEMWVTGEG